MADDGNYVSNINIFELWYQNTRKKLKHLEWNRSR